MPVYANPNARAVIVLRLDAKLKPRPEFYCKPLTKAEFIELGDAIDALYNDLQNTKQLTDKAYALLARYVTGWANMPDGFTLDDLVYSEVRELLSRMLYPMEHVEKK